MLEQQQKAGTFKRVIGYVADDIEGGETLSEAMAKYPKTFDRLFVNMVAAGEAGGVLDLILSRLADFMEKAAKLKARVKGAMIYPAVVMFAAFGIVMGADDIGDPKIHRSAHGNDRRSKAARSHDGTDEGEQLDRLSIRLGGADRHAVWRSCSFMRFLKKFQPCRLVLDMINAAAAGYGPDRQQDLHRTLDANARAR